MHLALVIALLAVVPLLEGRLHEVDVREHVEDIGGAAEGDYHLAPRDVAPDGGLVRVTVGVRVRVRVKG